MHNAPTAAGDATRKKLKKTLTHNGTVEMLIEYLHASMTDSRRNVTDHYIIIIIRI